MIAVSWGEGSGQWADCGGGNTFSISHFSFLIFNKFPLVILLSSNAKSRMENANDK